MLETLVLLDAAGCGPAPSIILTPSSGISVITVTGSGFPRRQEIRIFWNRVVVPGWIGDYCIRNDGTFCAIMTIQTQTPGTYNVTVTADGKSASALFVVLDTTGPQGPKGDKGDTGEQGPTGPQGEKGDSAALDILPLIISIVLSSAALLLSAFYRKKDNGARGDFAEIDQLLEQAKGYTNPL